MLLGKRFILSAKAHVADLRVLLEQLSRASERGPEVQEEKSQSACEKARPDSETLRSCLWRCSGCRKLQAKAARSNARAWGIASPCCAADGSFPSPRHAPRLRRFSSVCGVPRGVEKNTEDETGAAKLPRGCGTGPGTVLGAGEGPSRANLFPARPSLRAGLRVMSRAEQKTRHRMTPEVLGSSHRARRARTWRVGGEEKGFPAEERMGTTVVTGAALMLGITSLQSNSSNLASPRSPPPRVGRQVQRGKGGGGKEKGGKKKKPHAANLKHFHFK